MTDTWVNTACHMCYVHCGIRAHVVDGLVVALEGDPNNPQSRGRMCAKGKAGIMNHYNPYRLRVPMKRTNPQKGIGIDPQWQEITYEEAINTIVDRLKEIQDEPQRLYVYPWGEVGELTTFGMAFGTPHTPGGAAHDCGKTIHPIEHMAGGGFHQQVDLHHCNYCLYFGTNGAVASRGSYVHVCLDMAEARARGMKLVVVDPIGGYAAAKADEWIPIRPGTDAAFGLAMLNVLLNELHIFDTEFLKKGTNGPYLIGDDGLYVRDKESRKPLIFDPVDGVAKTHDDPDIKDYALDGSYNVDNRLGRPSFELLREHVKKYTPEMASKITSVPAETIRRITKEFGQAAQVGSTIVLEGMELPYRPAALDWARGPQGHLHGFHNSWALKLVNLVLGTVNVPGGIISTAAAGKNPFEFWPEGGVDGMLVHAGNGGQMVRIPSAFPGREPTRPLRMDVMELFPVCGHSYCMMPLVALEPQKYGIDYSIGVIIHSLGNQLLSNCGDLNIMERWYKSVSFIAGFAIEINETNEFDDIILPVPSYLERQDFPGGMSYMIPPIGQDDWYLQVRQPAVETMTEIRHPREITMEILDRLGLLETYFRLLNRTQRFTEQYKLDPKQKYSVDEIGDRLARSYFGPERGLDFLKKNGVVRYHRDPEESYPGPYMMQKGMRFPIYLEHFPVRGKELKAILSEMGLNWDLSDYIPLPEWMPCTDFEMRGKGEHDLVAIHYKLPFIYGAYGNENPWINEICQRAPYAYSVLINEDTGRRKGIEDGDEVWIESPVYKAKGRAKLTQCIHPEVVGIGGHFGAWAKGKPISQGKGIAFNALLPHDVDHIDKISNAMECCAPVKIRRVSA